MDWYIWGIAQKPHFHSPRLIRPLSVRELAARLLSGIVASNTEVLMVPLTIAPDAIAKPPRARVIPATSEVNHGFKEVA
jgi:hypothetical protein